MRFTEIKNIQPTVGDIVSLTLGTTVVESTINEITDEGIVVDIKQDKLSLIKEALGKIIPGPGSTYHQPRVVPIRKTLHHKPPRSYPRAAPTPAPAPAAAPEPKPAEFKDLSRCENAIDWGYNTLAELPLQLRKKLASYGNATVIEYLRLAASENDAYGKFGFEREDLKDCQNLLDEVLNNADIKQWADVLKHHLTESALVPVTGVYVKGPSGKSFKISLQETNLRVTNSKQQVRTWSCKAW